MPYPKLEREAEAELERILRTGRLKDVDLRLTRGHEVEWGPPLNPGYFSIPGGSQKWKVAPATVDVQRWLRLQNRAGGDNAFTFGEFKRSATSSTVERAAESVRSGRYDVPTPVLEVREDGAIPQEGRSRALGAKRGGARRMPIWVAVRVYR